MIWILLAACTDGTEPSGTCPASDTPTLDVAQGGAWNLPEGEVQMGTPPQGGAPYAPFEIRLVGADSSDAYRIEMEATVGEEVYTTPPYVERFVCRNVGEESGTRYTPDLHMRFFGAEPPDLDGRPVELSFVAYINGVDEPVATQTLDATFVWSLGPM